MAPRTSSSPTARPSRGQPWVRVGLAVLPNGTEGWVPRSALGGWSFVDTRLVINRARLTATLFRAGRVIFRARVGIGARATPTPAGAFYVRDRLRGSPAPCMGRSHSAPTRDRLRSATGPAAGSWASTGPTSRTYPGTDLPRLCPADQRRDPEARKADADRDAGEGRVSRRPAPRPDHRLLPGAGRRGEPKPSAGRRRLWGIVATAPGQLVSVSPGFSAPVLSTYSPVRGGRQAEAPGRPAPPGRAASALRTGADSG